MRAKIAVTGLKELRRDLKSLEDATPKEVSQVLKEGADIVAKDAAVRAPRRSGKLAGSIKPGTSGANAFVKSDLPYAAVHQWGGRVGRNKSVKIEGKHYLTEAAEAKEDEVAQKVEDGLHALIRRHGLDG